MEEHTVRVLTNLLDAPLVTPLDATTSVEPGVDSYAYQVVDLGDLDEDGRAETLLPLAYYSSFDASVAAVVDGSSISFGVSLAFGDSRLLAVSARDGLYGYRVADVGDVDGDGAPDLAIGGFREDQGGQDAGGVLTIPIPH